MAAVSTLPFTLRSSSRVLSRSRKPLLHRIPAIRPLSTKHPKSFVAPTEDELQELRERVQEFTSECSQCREAMVRCPLLTMAYYIGREIPEDVAARTDAENEFPAEMWKKLGNAGYVFLDFNMSTSMAMYC